MDWTCTVYLGRKKRKKCGSKLQSMLNFLRCTETCLSFMVISAYHKTFKQLEKKEARNANCPTSFCTPSHLSCISKVSEKRSMVDCPISRLFSAAVNQSFHSERPQSFHFESPGWLWHHLVLWLWDLKLTIPRLATSPWTLQAGNEEKTSKIGTSVAKQVTEWGPKKSWSLRVWVINMVYKIDL